MAAPRSIQFIALRNLSRAATHHQARHLHITGPATYASQALSRDPPSSSKRRKTTESPSEPISSSKARQFNTSRDLKANHDTSTIDFAYLPDIMSPADTDVYAQVRVPILPTIEASRGPSAAAIEPEETLVMKPQISTMSADAVYLPMSEMSDGHAMNIDFHAMADRVAMNLRRMKVPVEQQAGMMKQLWNEMVDDLIIGSKKATVA